MTQDYPVHVDGTPAQLPYVTIATFPMRTFLENIAVRSNGQLLVSNMLSGTIHHLDPDASDPQSSITKVHKFPPQPETPSPRKISIPVLTAAA